MIDLVRVPGSTISGSKSGGGVGGLVTSYLSVSTPSPLLESLGDSPFKVIIKWKAVSD